MYKNVNVLNNKNNTLFNKNHYVLFYNPTQKYKTDRKTHPIIYCLYFIQWTCILYRWKFHYMVNCNVNNKLLKLNLINNDT